MYPGAGTALLLVDLQVAFCSPRGTLARDGRDVSQCAVAARRCQKLADAARHHRVDTIWSRQVMAPDYRDGGRLVAELRPRLRELGALRRGGEDVELFEELCPGPEDAIVDKPRASALYGSGLEALLRGGGVETVVVAGVTTAMCVESTVRELADRDFRVLVVGDACADWSAERHQASLQSMAFGFATVVGHDEALALLAGREPDAEVAS